MSWLRLANVGDDAFPVEVFGYPEESADDNEIIYHIVLHDSSNEADIPPMPKRRMRLKLVLADGQVLYGDERQSQDDDRPRDS